ncbi:MAG TPA: SDR family oxidoreductase [Bacillota bacterium]|nr:SDR family oxidoreductase [Bacillota bacterium]HOB86195.1 SDR family oxidoreductase [Bacillota bacterium]HOP69897.1 SDR family oxidoreductase [Bacillota bacterium]HPT34661.1 SDR family oxidoreductase [Bacillota bacterium]HPZ64857.1 SDR family oxidoreductase [Bacillota bacterium]
MELPFSINLGDKVAVITGGGGVLCSMFARALACCGARVALLDLNLEAAQKAAAEIVAEGGRARAFQANVLDRENLLAVKEEVSAAFGPCDILINGAGGNNPRATTDKEYYEKGDAGDPGIRSFFSLDPESIQLVFGVNFTGTLLATQVFARDMAEGKGGSIINVTSLSAFTPLTKIPAYSAAKAAVSNFTRWLAVYFSRANIRVNAIAPGFFVSAQNRDLLYNEDGTPTSRTNKILAATPLQRFGREEELIAALLYLLSDGASFVTGIVLPVDGGFSAYSGV